MRNYTIALFIFAVGLSYSIIVKVQADSGCPEIPNGLLQVNNMLWDNYGESILLSLGQSTQSEYLQTWLIWEIQSGDLTPITATHVVNALQLADALEIWDTFISGNDRTQLSISPNIQNALYLQDYQLFAVNAHVTEPRELGILSENLADVDVRWISDDEAIVVVEPIYGEGYETYHVCLQGDCFNNISRQIGGITGYPDVYSEASEMVFQIDSDIVFYDLDTQTLSQRITTDLRLLLNINPIWDAETNSVYFIGFDSSDVQLIMYRLDLDTEEIAEETILPSDISPSNWLLNLDERYILYSDPNLAIYCF